MIGGHPCVVARPFGLHVHRSHGVHRSFVDFPIGCLNGDMAFQDLLLHGKLSANLTKPGTPGLPVGFSQAKSKLCGIVVGNPELFQKRRKLSESGYAN